MDPCPSPARGRPQHVAGSFGPRPERRSEGAQGIPPPVQKGNFKSEERPEPSTPMGSAAPRPCTYCWATNPPGLECCQACHRALPKLELGAAANPRLSPDPLSDLSPGRWGPIGPLSAILGPRAALYFSLGLASTLVGVFLLFLASVFNPAAGTSMSSCSIRSLCSQVSVLHLTFLGVGGALIALGILSWVYAAHRSARESPWMNLSP